MGVDLPLRIISFGEYVREKRSRGESRKGDGLYDLGVTEFLGEGLCDLGVTELFGEALCDPGVDPFDEIMSHRESIFLLRDEERGRATSCRGRDGIFGLRRELRVAAIGTGEEHGEHSAEDDISY